jgi:hypothetical protein
MKKLTFILLTAWAGSAYAQGTDEPFFHLRKFYGASNIGTGRSQAMGGAFTALGGDQSNAYINPAGIGFYNRAEFSGTLSIAGNRTNASYIGSQTTTNRSPLDIGHMGVIFSRDGVGSRVKKSNFAITYSNLNNFNNTYKFSGSNPDHSISDSFSELANGSGLTPAQIKEDYDQYNNAPDGYSMAVMGGLLYYENGKYFVNEDALPIDQNGTVKESGNLGQLSLAYGANFDDKTYLGASLGIQSLRFDRSTAYNEFFPSNAIHLRSQYYDNELSISGTGFNLTVGIIQRLNDQFNIGASISTPTFLWVRDSFIQYAGVNAVSPGSVIYYNNAQTAVDEFTYRITSPLKASAGVSAYLPKKVGVISVEAEYLGYSRMGIKAKDAGTWSDAQDGLIQDEYKDVVNLKAGIELRHGIGRLRGGINYIQDPLRYASDYNVKKNNIISSIGVGIRNSTFFADLTYSRTVNTGAYNPYVLDAGDHYSVTYKQTRGWVGISIGTFL